MRIAILAVVFSPEYGVARVIKSQLPYLIQSGIEVDIYACEIQHELADSLHGVRVVRIPTHLRGLRWALEQGCYDLVVAHSHPFFRLLPRLRSRAATLLYEHGNPPVDLFPPEERAARMLLVADMAQNVYPVVSAVVTISHFAARHIDGAKARVLYNGADHFGRSPMAEPCCGEPIRVLCVSRYGIGEQRYKGLDDLARLAHDLGDGYRVVLLGSGPRKEKERLERAGLLVVEYQGDVQLVEQYERCDVLVSLSKFENFNLPLAEAGFFHKAALALDVAAHAEVTPLVFAHYGALAEFLKGATRQSLRQQGEAMFEYVQARFRWADNGSALVRLVEELVPFPVCARPRLGLHLAIAFWRIREAVRSFFRMLVRRR